MNVKLSVLKHVNGRQIPVLEIPNEVLGIPQVMESLRDLASLLALFIGCARPDLDVTFRATDEVSPVLKRIAEQLEPRCPACAGTIGDPLKARVIEWCEEHAPLSVSEKARLCKYMLAFVDKPE